MAVAKEEKCEFQKEPDPWAEDRLKYISDKQREEFAKEIVERTQYILQAEERIGQIRRKHFYNDRSRTNRIIHDNSLSSLENCSIAKLKRDLRKIEIGIATVKEKIKQVRIMFLSKERKKQSK